jgi:hypothetical protein
MHLLAATGIFGVFIAAATWAARQVGTTEGVTPSDAALAFASWAPVYMFTLFIAWMVADQRRRRWPHGV